MLKLRTLSLLVLLLSALSAHPQAANPSDPSPTAEAQNLLDAGHLEQALKTLDPLSQHQPEPAGVERLRGMAFYEQGKIQLAAASFERAIAQDPSDREAMQMQGVVLFRSGKPADAIPFLEKAHLSI